MIGISHTSPPDVVPLSCCGYLYLQEKTWRGTRWVVRYFELRTKHFNYYLNTAMQGTNKSCGSIPISKCVELKSDTVRNCDGMHELLPISKFSIKTSSGQTWTMRTSSSEEFHMWTTRLSQAISSHIHETMVVSHPDLIRATSLQNMASPMVGNGIHRQNIHGTNHSPPSRKLVQELQAMEGLYPQNVTIIRKQDISWPLGRPGGPSETVTTHQKQQPQQQKEYMVSDGEEEHSAEQGSMVNFFEGSAASSTTSIASNRHLLRREPGHFDIRKAYNHDKRNFATPETSKAKEKGLPNVEECYGAY